MTTPNCVICGESQFDHHEFEPTMPKGCKCQPGSWIGAQRIKRVCNKYVCNTAADMCETCEHDEACHI